MPGKEVGIISIKVTPNLKGFYREVQAAVKWAEKLKVKIPVEPDMGNFRQEVAASTAGMTARVKVRADVDRGLLDSVANSLGNLKAPSFGSGINPTGYMLILGAAAALTPLIAGSLGAISAALLTLPGLIAAVAVPIGALALGIDGFKRAAERLKPAFDGLKESMSAAVENQFGPVFDQLGKAIPTLAANLPKVTQGMADVAKSIVDSVTSGEGLGRIESLISNIGAAISRSAPGLTSFVDGLLNLAEKFSGKLPAIADWINRTGESFSKWVTDFTTAGPDGVSKFDNAMSGLGDTLQMLGGGLVDILNKSLEFFSDPQKIQSFKAELDGLIASISTLVDLINSLAAAFSKVPGLSDGEANGVMDFAPIQIQGAIELIKQIPTAWEGVKLKAAEVWNSIPSMAVTAVTGIRSAMMTLPGLLSSLWSTITANATSAFSMVGAAVSNGARNVVNTAGNIFRSMGSVIANAFSAAVSAVQTAFSQMVSAAASGAQQVVAEVQALGGKIAAAAGNFGSILVAAGKALMDGLLSGIKAGLSAVLDFASGIAAKIAAVKGPLPKDRKELIPAGEALMEGLGTGIENGLDPVLDRAREIAKQIFSAFKETFGTAPASLAFNLGSMQGDLSGLQTSLESTATASRDLTSSLTAPTAELASGSSLLGDDVKGRLDELKMAYDQLELQRKQLKVDKNAAGTKEEKKAIQDQIDQIQAQKDQIALEKDKLKLQQQQTGQMGEQKTLAQFLGEQIASTWQQGTDAVAGFARSNLDQAMSDLGIGGGAITNGLNAGLDWGVQALGNVMNIQVNSVDDAIAVKNNEVNKQALTYTRR
ncbi:tape measure protein [Mycobacterium phage Euphoria]|uniref:Tape measure protein n=1 Tax=Mycobacterium phage Euphoria TaxID=2922223 RepID=G1EV76_9CAUD|nr:tape measure protein [Mycobacterium phage Euphoria]AEJ93685.1 tape measure protein [Mycobacterium phage Euphoria]